MKQIFYASFDEGKGVSVGVIGKESEPAMWFENVNEFDRFLNMLRQFRHGLPYVPEVFWGAFED